MNSIVLVFEGSGSEHAFSKLNMVYALWRAALRASDDQRSAGVPSVDKLIVDHDRVHLLSPPPFGYTPSRHVGKFQKIDASRLRGEYLSVLTVTPRGHPMTYDGDNYLRPCTVGS